MGTRLTRNGSNAASQNERTHGSDDVMTTDGHEDSSRLQRVLAFHRPRYTQDQSGKVDSERLPICTGCEVNFWPCPTVKLGNGTWESVPV